MVVYYHEGECHEWKLVPGSLSSMSRSQRGLIWPKCEYFYDFFWTSGPFATKLGLLVHHQKPECSVEKLDYCIQGQSHSEGSICQRMFVGMTSSEPQNILLPNLVWWCSIMSQSVIQKKNWFTVFHVKVTARAYIIRMWLFLLYLLNCWSVCNQTFFIYIYVCFAVCIPDWSRSSTSFIGTQRAGRQDCVQCPLLANPTPCWPWQITPVSSTPSLIFEIASTGSTRERWVN